MEQELTCPICNFGEVKIFTQKNNFKIYQCLNCGLGFVWPTPENLEKLYTENYFKKTADSAFGYTNYDLDKEAMKSVFIHALAEIEKMVEGRRLFDIGAATGYFLDLARGRSWQTAGSEVSEYAAALARAKGHEIFLGRLPCFDLAGVFDTITMWDVLEHVDAPTEYLKRINRMLSLGGLLVVNTIDRESWWAKMM